MTIRPLSPFDAAEMAELEKRCFSLPWSLASVKAELRNPIARYIGAFEYGKLAGYAGIQIVADEGYITNVASAPESRRRGIAGTLLRLLLEAAGEYGLRFVTLEVREGNAAARALYEKHGFTEAGRRRGYYDAPKEDAILMTIWRNDFLYSSSKGVKEDDNR
ncbi:MAG: ribosomal protein S18-alanine N-acetyltransferase [Oscillospiraceae bacterium]|jgi:ribosomal-protein-alanine N-acetyltransferase|nr:ribosomal protein S18-alanine N-acetyltransferase [Oscillospiraceae bacterium]